MNASAASLDREVEVQSKIGKVRTFGRIGRVPCAVLFAFGLIGTVGTLISIALGQLSGWDNGIGVPGLGSVSTEQIITPALKLWVFLVVFLLSGASLAVVHQLYRLFGNLSAGAIFTHENVRRVRNVGVLTLASAVLEILVPVATAALVSSGFIDASAPVSHELVFSWQSVSALISAGLILLASWIMDVGLYEKTHAEALQRDADLVI